jgi:MFS superfamily sulfate permease-like transporter
MLGLQLDRETVIKDLLASIVVFLVALPLCMGIALASGVPPAAGLISGIIGGLIVGFLAGSPLQVSGPAAGLAVIVYQIVQEHGIALLAASVVVAGVIQVVAGLVRMGRWFRAISPSVIYGMLAGIGVLIFASQFHVMVDDAPRDTGIRNLLSIPEAIYKGFFGDGDTPHQLAALIGVTTIATLVLWDKFKPKGVRVLPGALISVATASSVAAWFGFPIQFVDVPSNLLDGVQSPTWEAFASLAQPALLFGAVGLAFIASAETLLCATAVDQMQTGPRTNYNRELAAQGVGNILCGALGALPMTGVIVRSGANVQAGAKTRLSAILHGVWLLALVVAFPEILRSIPTASLAAVLVFTGYKLVNVNQIQRLAKFGRMELVIYFATVAGIVIFDLLTGVLLGLALAILKLTYTFSHLSITVEHDRGRRRADIRLAGSATFVRLPELAEVLEAMPAGAEVHLHIDKLDYIDHACLELLTSWEKLHEKSDGALVIEWDELVNRYYRRTTEPAKVKPDKKS